MGRRLGTGSQGKEGRGNLSEVGAHKVPWTDHGKRREERAGQGLLMRAPDSGTDGAAQPGWAPGLPPSDLLVDPAAGEGQPQKVLLRQSHKCGQEGSEQEAGRKPTRRGGANHMPPSCPQATPRGAVTAFPCELQSVKVEDEGKCPLPAPRGEEAALHPARGPSRASSAGPCRWYLNPPGQLLAETHGPCGAGTDTSPLPARAPQLRSSPAHPPTKRKAVRWVISSAPPRGTPECVPSESCLIPDEAHQRQAPYPFCPSYQESTSSLALRRYFTSPFPLSPPPS